MVRLTDAHMPDARVAGVRGPSCGMVRDAGIALDSQFTLEVCTNINHTYHPFIPRTTSVTVCNSTIS